MLVTAALIRSPFVLMIALGLLQLGRRHDR